MLSYKKLILLSLLCLSPALFASQPAASVSTDTTSYAYTGSTDIASDNLDDLVIKGIIHISNYGEKFEAHAGNGQQAFDVSYTLSNPNNRLHSLRQPTSIKYFCRELLAYFKGSLKVDDGLAQAASFWKTLADKNGEIASNYGHYIFHQKIPNINMTQYDWAIKKLTEDINCQDAFININQPHHKNPESKDFPCTLGMHFFVHDNNVCCVVSSRSTDVYTGLPYDMGFFAFVTELVYKDLKERLPQEKSGKLKLGYVTMKTQFTQIYDKTREKTLALLKYKDDESIETYASGEITSQGSLDSSYLELNEPHMPLPRFSIPSFLAESTTTPLSQGFNEPCMPSSMASMSLDESTSTPVSRGSVGSNTPLKPNTISPEKSKTLKHYSSSSSSSSEYPHSQLQSPRSPTPEKELMLQMPPIENAQEVLQDIYKQTAKTTLMQWIYTHAQLPIPQ